MPVRSLAQMWRTEFQNYSWLTLRHDVLAGINVAAVVLPLALAFGVVSLVIGLLRLGRLVAFIPAPVITGFTSGVALIIAIGQLNS